MALLRDTRAHEADVLRQADEFLDLSNDRSRDAKVVGQDDREVTDYEVVVRSKLRVDSRKWLLSKLLPKTSGDCLDLNHSGELAKKSISDDQLEARVLALACATAWR